MAKSKKIETPKPIEEQVAEVENQVSSAKGLKRVKVDEAELARLQAEGLLVGYDAATQEAIVNE